MYLYYNPRKLKLTLLIIFLILVFSVTYGCGNGIQKTKEKHSDKVAEILKIIKYEEPIRDLIELNLKIIVSAQQSMASSNPYDFIQEKKKEYDEIVSLGQPALEYMLTKFETSTENGLEEYIMAVACSEILGQKEKDNDWSSGREWYEKFLESR